MGNAEVNYAFTNNFSVRFRSGIDFYNDLRKSKRAFSTKRFANGAYREDEITYNELNTDVLFSYQKVLSSNFKFNVSSGGNPLNAGVPEETDKTVGLKYTPVLASFNGFKIFSDVLLILTSAYHQHPTNGF